MWRLRTITINFLQKDCSEAHCNGKKSHPVIVFRNGVTDVLVGVFSLDFELV